MVAIGRRTERTSIATDKSRSPQTAATLSIATTVVIARATGRTAIITATPNRTTFAPKRTVDPARRRCP
jgi:hypothetical protein